MSQGRRFMLEICANSIQSALNAQAGGADRVELCQNLESGGITPSYGLIQLAKQSLTIPVHVLIRPRAGNFIYDENEFAIMLADIQACHILECDGVVVGILDYDHRVDVARTRLLVEAAAPMQVTFHRAFDDAIDRFRALEEVISTGCTRLLTAGGASGQVKENADALAELRARAKSRITIMPGYGLDSKNVLYVAQVSGASEFHTSASKRRVSGQATHHMSVFQYERKETDVDAVKKVVTKLKSYELEIDTDEALPAYSA